MSERKKQILTEATRLFSKDGYDKVTVKDLAQACGITSVNSSMTQIDKTSATANCFSSRIKIARISDVLAITRNVPQTIVNASTFFRNSSNSDSLPIFRNAS